MRSRLFNSFITVLSLAFVAGTQRLPAQRTPPRDTMSMPPGMDMGQATQMTESPFGISMDRMGSGTTWIPDAVALPSRHFTAGAWSLMVHGFVFAQYNKQSGPRGADQFGSLNWGMLMASREVAGGTFQARTMLSLDALTVGGGGYPLLLQSGEQYRGKPNFDRQHPHDFFMELGALYERKVAGPVGVSVYVAPAGEPALGPVAFMHRPSAMDVPMAPLGHHWQDATHISFGVLTAGVFTHDWKVEGSVFNGREPDDQRWNFDPIRLDSYSGRITYNPTKNWSFATGYGYLKSPEFSHPDESIHRLTGSVLHGAALGDDGQVATTVSWGANAKGRNVGWTHSVLVESEAVMDQRNTVFGRVEYVQKSAEDLVLDTPKFGFASDRRFNVSTFSLGYIREVGRWGPTTIGLGGLGSLNFLPSALEVPYGSRTPFGAMAFLRIRPVRAKAGAMDHSHMEGMKNAQP